MIIRIIVKIDSILNKIINKAKILESILRNREIQLVLTRKLRINQSKTNKN